MKARGERNMAETKPQGKPAPTEHKASAPVQKGKEYIPLPGGCQSWHCKAHATRFSFCEEHYEHFKFGLIKKNGEQVSDYEKKIEHFKTWKAKQQRAHRVA